VNSAKLKIYALFSAVFVLGAAFGGAALHAFRERDVEALVSDQTGEVRERSGISALARKLDLNDEQREKIRDIMRRYRFERRELSRTMHESCGAPLREQKQRMDSEIRSVLDQRQQRAYDEVERKTRDRMPFGRRRD
jgi:Spy/CpxP family protein refolding chaperone